MTHFRPHDVLSLTLIGRLASFTSSLKSTFLHCFKQASTVRIHTDSDTNFNQKVHNKEGENFNLACLFQDYCCKHIAAAAENTNTAEMLIVQMPKTLQFLFNNIQGSKPKILLLSLTQMELQIVFHFKELVSCSNMLHSCKSSFIS